MSLYVFMSQTWQIYNGCFVGFCLYILAMVLSHQKECYHSFQGGGLILIKIIFAIACYHGLIKTDLRKQIWM